jgi:hypothetical protein
MLNKLFNKYNIECPIWNRLFESRESWGRLAVWYVFASVIKGFTMEEHAIIGCCGQVVRRPWIHLGYNSWSFVGSVTSVHLHNTLTKLGLLSYVFTPLPCKGKGKCEAGFLI